MGTFHSIVFQQKQSTSRYKKTALQADTRGIFL